MKLMIGFAAGFGVGMYVATRMSEQQRSQLAERASRVVERAQDSPIAKAVTDNAKSVTGAATKRATDAVDRAGEAAADAVGGGGDDPTAMQPPEPTPSAPTSPGPVV